MQKKLVLKVLPAEAKDQALINERIIQQLSLKGESLTGYNVLKSSLDARGKKVTVNLQVMAYINEPYHHRTTGSFSFKDVSRSPHKTIIIGAGPAGLFAALLLLEKGIKPILLERGKDVRSRRRDLALLNKSGIINPESNYCFGEGGAGTYSDGKLYTRSSKRGDIDRILQLFVHFGAEENILYDAHPHIGTNKLPHIITAIRKKITECGGEFHFEQKVVGLYGENNRIKYVQTSGEKFEGNDFILATGHSARDIFTMLHEQNIFIEAKPFALGVRIEHPQDLIDSIQYHYPLKAAAARDPFLPPASYSLVQQVNDKGVFSFCMCPGGIIAPASTAPEELVVNGWSPSKRNNPFANSGMVVQVSDADILKGPFVKFKDHPLRTMFFQQMVEQKAYKAGGGKFVAPAQRLADFCENKLSSTLPENSYIPGVNSSKLSDILPGFVNSALASAFKSFGKKLKGFYTNDAIVVATESRTSSPVRIPRDPHSLNHPQFTNLYPCGEGAGYAGGIVSAAMDGERIAAMVAALKRS